MDKLFEMYVRAYFKRAGVKSYDSNESGIRISRYDDKTAVLIVAENAHNEALAVHTYPFETSLDKQGVLLLRSDTSNSVTFGDG